ncbi:aldo/keto reductase [Devosia limi DSM 17137]|uniref:Aldo/keto reductase n=1 Tax=Devosia limi DSM 17137 TaxID=1121477 RepID=A0A0F5LJQ4_9HYPH|nr:aldo/keto reductase [Devosia limi]KKB82631.1 aldo/keto reductase [Devosia limi DSM 17137]SHE42287.1 Predicted oxidoreductase [Devosia limi DSM 17137]
MKQRRLGKTGYQVSEIGLGCWQLGGDFGPVGDETANAILDAANAAGVNFWDTADVYGGGLSERRIGSHAKAAGVRVATKLGRSGALYPNNYSLDGVRQSLVGSATRLGVETLDLAQLHCVPPELLRDGAIFGWMDQLKAEGLVRHWGASVETIEEGLLCLEQDGCATLQIIFNLFRQDASEVLLPRAAERDVGIIVRLPLASGLLSGKFDKNTRFDVSDHRNYNRDGQAFSVGETFSGIPFERGVELVQELKGLAPESMPLSQFALRWILDHPQVSTIIAGVSKPEQLADNVAASEQRSLFPALMGQLASWYRDEVKPAIRGEV